MCGYLVHALVYIKVRTAGLTRSTNGTRSLYRLPPIKSNRLPTLSNLSTGARSNHKTYVFLLRNLYFFFAVKTGQQFIIFILFLFWLLTFFSLNLIYCQRFYFFFYRLNFTLKIKILEKKKILFIDKMFRANTHPRVNIKKFSNTRQELHRNIIR